LVRDRRSKRERERDSSYQMDFSLSIQETDRSDKTRCLCVDDDDGDDFFLAKNESVRRRASRDIAHKRKMGDAHPPTYGTPTPLLESK